MSDRRDEHDHEHDPAADDRAALEQLALDARPGPARKLSAADADRMIFAALDAAASRGASEVPPARGRRWLATFAAAGIALAATGAAAALWVMDHRARHEGVEAPTEDGPAPSRTIAKTSSTVAERTVEAEPRALADPTVEDPASPADVDANARGAKAVPADERAPSEPGSTPRARDGRSATRTSPDPARSPEDLLDRANALRGKKAWPDAERTYVAVTRLAPRSNAAYVALIAAASIRLEHLGDARGALSAYREAERLYPAGALDADVRFGIAAAHRGLGDRDAERTALSRLLDAHPRSLFAESARRRLAELEAER